mgnify:CR=1 FL=1|jgi:hypothetical protein|tara:strand:- start:65 stop:517 length:453 start_codon:yes stop_codon:yes gene_type:complete
MPYALIPDGYTLKKVTKTQEKAVKDLRRSEYIKELLDNETTLPLILGPVLVPIIALAISELLKDVPGLPKDYLQTKGLQQRVESLLTTLQFKRQEADAPVGSGIQSGRVGEVVRPGEASEDFIWSDIITKNPLFGYKEPVRRPTLIRRSS